MAGIPWIPATAPLPAGPTADAYRIVNYHPDLIGTANPECLAIMPRYDSGLKWPDPANPLPDDPLWGGGIRAGIPWDGTFYRDLSRYNLSGSLFWSPYLKPGSAPGNQNGYWYNFGRGWCHLHNDNFAQMLTGAAPRLWWDSVTGTWRLIIEATQYVTYAVVPVWIGTKPASNDPVGTYTKIAGCDPLTTLTVAAN
ncbi:MAG: hypothetical protein PCFJNLEI_00931 [Verrucomicrobiae bacterium]|nr:hypothetical protein [Verrucomicrobiae bacterium]